MARNYEDDFLRDLYNHIANYDPDIITERRATKYWRTYYRYHNLKIAVTREAFDNSVVSISITKM